MSADEAGFLKTISDNPADEAARLVYADWLDERGDPRAAFARLSGEFLHCVRGLADLRRAYPVEWLEVMDPLFNRFCLIRLPDLGSGVAQATVTALYVTPGGSMLKGQTIFYLATNSPVQREFRAEESGLVTAVFVRPGETVTINQPLFAYFSGQEKDVLRTPRAPMLEFIYILESQRKTLQQNPIELNEAMLVRHATALQMVFGRKAINEARSDAWRELGWDPGADLGVIRKQRNITDEEWVQVRIDVHIKSLHRLLARHGQPDGFRELPDATFNE